MNIIMCGSRGYQNLDKVYRFIEKLPIEYKVIVGDAKGVDAIALHACEKLGHEHEIYKANWEADGRQAGIRRNLSMLNQLPVRLIAFWDGTSPGTGFMVKTALARRINLQVYFDF